MAVPDTAFSRLKCFVRAYVEKNAIRRYRVPRVFMVQGVTLSFPFLKLRQRSFSTTIFTKDKVNFTDVYSCDDIPPDTGELVGDPRLQVFNTSSDFPEFRKRVFKPFPLENIRNVSIIAHVDHGKTTLTDALLHKANLLPAGGGTGTFTDRLRVERERGITIKAQTCSIFLRRKCNSSPGAFPKPSNHTIETWYEEKRKDSQTEMFLINLIDTPGHIDFQYEVSRSLSASEGAALLVDVKQGVQAQTLTHFFAAVEQNLTVIPVLTKMDQLMTSDMVRKTLTELEDSTGLLRHEVVLTSAKARKGLESFFQAIIDRVPAPCGRYGLSDMRQLPPMHPDSEQLKLAEQALLPFRALLFDCWTAESSGMVNSTNRNLELGELYDSTSGRRKLARGVVAGERKDGIYCLVRVIDGTVTYDTAVTFFHSQKTYRVLEVGIIHPSLHPIPALTAGMVGYLFFAGLRRADVLIGDTFCTIPTGCYELAGHAMTRTTPSSSMIDREAVRQPQHSHDTVLKEDGKATSHAKNATVIEPVSGFKIMQPSLFASFYPDEGVYIESFREAVDLLRVNDPSVTVESVHCQTLGPGLQLGFLGLLHMQVFKDRLLDEFGQSVLVTPPQVQYMCVGHGNDPDDPRQRVPLTVSNWKWPHEGIKAYLEPVVRVTLMTPKDYFSEIHSVALSDYRAQHEGTQPIEDARVILHYQMPLADLARGFFSIVKTLSKGYATLEYQDPVYVCADIVKVDIIVNKAKISALSFICLQNEAHARGRRILNVLKQHINRSSTDLPLQAVIGTKIIARETVKAYRKDVTAKIHAGDITRKQKKWNDQKKGKERIARRRIGTVMLEQSVLAAAMGAISV